MRRQLAPLTRGSLSGSLRGPAFGRLIPAYAGSTFVGIRRAFKTWAHPRLRGEHDELRERGAFSVGSSPLTRGAPRLAYASSTVGGLIPAYAGSTPLPRTPPGSLSAHPRLRGEHVPQAGQARLVGGSSPLTRGAPDYYDSETVVTRLIPAYAGSTYSPHWLGIRGKAHPRLRGEH